MFHLRVITTGLIALIVASASWAACPFNVSLSTTPSAVSNGALLKRYVDGVQGSAFTASLTSAGANAVRNYIDQNKQSLDVDGDGEVTALDAMIISRHLLGFPTNRVVQGLTLSGERKTATAIQQFLADGCPATVVFPIEVIGEAGHVETRKFTLSSAVPASDVIKLQLTCHRCAWRDGAVASGRARGAKASVRLNGGAWTDINETTATMFAAEAAVGGLNGGFNTTRFTIAISGVQNGVNTISFRFNTDDGFTNGFRILSFDLLTANNARGVYASSVVQDNPTRWQAEAATGNLAADITEGRALWTGKVALKVSPLSSATIQASCSSCHAVDARDLKYFNYSDQSIVARSKFHGLTTVQGKQLATYVRSRDVPAPLQARPWNPPYQPGAGLDTRPVNEWAAGAGLGAVLETDAAMSASLFPNGISANAVRQVINTASTLNIREIPIAIQFPDWSDWLSEEHPIDIIGRELFVDGAPDVQRPLQRQFDELEAFLASAPVAELIANGSLYRRLNDFANASSTLPNPTMLAALNRNFDELRFTQSLMKWGAVKQWEIMQRYALEDKAPAVHGTFGEARSWLTLRRNVFEIAPHRSAKLRDPSGEIILVPNFPYQSLMQGKYASTAWYQLQLTINAGNRKGVNLWPVDWNYQPAHIDGLYAQAGGPANPYRMLASHTKMYQQYADGDDLANTAMGFRQLHINRIVPGSQLGKTLDELPTVTRLRAYNAMLRSTMDILERYAPSDWERSLDTTDNVLEPANYVLTKKNIARNQLNRECFTNQHANCWYSSIPFFKEIGVDADVIGRLVDWGKAIWPAPENNWDALR
jgi:hypothetical protein